MPKCGEVEKRRKKEGGYCGGQGALFIKKSNQAKVRLHLSFYCKIKNDQPKASVELFDKLAKFYGITIDQMVDIDTIIPIEITLEDKTATEQARLIAEFDETIKTSSSV